MRSLLPFLILAASLPLQSFAADKPDPLAVAYSRCTTAAMKPGADPADGIVACKEPAEAGVPGAQYAMGALLINRANGVASPEAVQWLERAVAAGHPGSAYILASVLASKNPARAAELLRVAACGEYTPALNEFQKRGLTFDRTTCLPRRDTDFSGEWSGKLPWVKVAPGSTSTGLELKVAFSGSDVKVFMRHEDAWIEVKPGLFKVARLDETAVVSVLDSGSDFDGKWIESWSLTLMRISDDEAVVTFSRTVNNRDMPGTLAWRTFSTAAEGRMKRSAKLPL
ncbi:MAG: hypothetical protein QOI24_2857 [Acidobacteriota bacterium]|jgi:hypothetical protein|nr:hypothetical protein [Acidobacteriota bacterium]